MLLSVYNKHTYFQNDLTERFIKPIAQPVVALFDIAGEDLHISDQWGEIQDEDHSPDDRKDSQTKVANAGVALALIWGAFLLSRGGGQFFGVNLNQTCVVF